ncbi:MAG: hypothetical protein IJS90_09380 [Clostridia bacterium]|nr:hypothetical protein [Clostridia bacterium]
MKKYKVILTVLFVVLLAAAAVVVTGVLDINKKGPDEPATDPDEISAEYTNTYTVKADVPLPLMKTDFENVFYTMSKQGDVKFYEVSGGEISELEETGNYEVSAKCSSQTLTAQIHYIEQEEHVFGCGLFTNIMHPEVLIYDYAFFKVTDMFNNYRNTAGTDLYDRGYQLLLIDVDSSRFYSDEKVYSEAFALDENHETTLFLSNDQRTVGMDAMEKTDYKMFTDDILNQHNSTNVLFFSSRYYVDYADSGFADIFTSGGSGTNIDNVRYVIDVDTLHFWNYEEETYFFRDNDDGTFTLKAYNPSSGETRSLETFSGDLSEDYLIKREYILNKKTGEVMNILKGDKYQSIYSILGYEYKTDMFGVSEQGKYCCVRCVKEDGEVLFTVTNLETGEKTVYSNEIFADIASVNLLNDGTVVVSVSTGENSASYYQLVAKF